LFATINSTQKPVDRSLTFELFGYNISDEPEDSWSPDKLAVFLTRKLNTEEGSPLRGRVTIAPEGDLLLGDNAYNDKWHVSMATIVDGIIRLISSNPKQDANELLKEMPARKRSVLSAARPKDRSPLRPLYLDGNDKVLYSVTTNYLMACRSVFWQSAREGSFIIKTVGIQALFDILRLLGPEILDTKKASVQFFTERLVGAKNIDFASAQFRNASGSGRGEIKNAIKAAIQL
jgi:DNA phosphorothioation-associated DGQHR protein 1